MAKHIFTRSIGGGLDLDSPSYLVEQDKLNDAINVSHMFDGKKNGILNPCLGIKHTNYVFRTRIEGRGLTDAMKLFDNLDPVNAFDFGDSSMLICTLEEEMPEYGGFFTAFYWVKPHIWKEDTDTFDYEVIEMYLLKGERFDETYSYACYQMNNIRYFYVACDTKPLRTMMVSDTLECKLESFFRDESREHAPQVKKFIHRASMVPPSVTRYTYRVMYDDGNFSHFSKMSEPFAIPADYPKKATSDETKDWFSPGVAADKRTDIKSSLCIQVECDTSAYANAKSVQLYAIRYFSNLGFGTRDPIVEKVGDQEWDDISTFIDGQHEFVSELAYADVQAELEGEPFFSVAHAICVKDNVLYAGNVFRGDDYSAALSAYDVRVWQFNSRKNAVDSNGDMYTLPELISFPANRLYVQNDCTDAEDSYSKAGNTTISSPYCMYTHDGKTFGAEGMNVKIEFTYGTMYYGGMYPENSTQNIGTAVEDATNNTMENPSYKFSKYMRGLNAPSYHVGLDHQRGDYNGQWFSANGMPDGTPELNTMVITRQDSTTEIIEFCDENDVESNGHSYANPCFSSKFKALQHDSVYRLGCYFEMEDGSFTDVKLMGDIRTPSLNTRKFALFEDHRPVSNAAFDDYPVSGSTTERLRQHVEIKFYPLFLEVTLQHLPEGVKNFKVVFALRKMEDRNVYANGVFHQTAAPFVSDQNVVNDFYSSSLKYSLPPMPILGRGHFFFGGVIGKHDTDWYNCERQGHPVWRKHKQFETPTYGGVVLFNSPCEPMEIIGHKSSSNMDFRVWYPSTVQVNSMQHTPSFLFYAPELDYLDRNGKTLIEKLSNEDLQQMKISMNCFLSSIFPAGKDRGQLSSVYSPLNDSFGLFLRFENYSNMGSIYSDKTASTKNSLAFYDGLLLTNDTLYPNRDYLYREDETMGCTMFMNASVIPPNNTDDKTKVLNSGQFVKCMKYFIAWDEHRTTAGHIDIRGKSFSLDNTITVGSGMESPEDVYQYLFPNTYCGFHPSAYPGSKRPKRIVPVRMKGMMFVNMAPLWSGMVSVLGTDFLGGHTRTPEGSFITNSSCRTRNHMMVRNYYSADSFTHMAAEAVTPYHWGNQDAAITPITDHCLPMDLAGQDTDNTRPEHQRLKAHTTKCYSGITWDALITDKMEFPGKSFEYPTAVLPSTDDYVFQDVRWYGWEAKLRSWELPERTFPARHPLKPLYDEAWAEIANFENASTFTGAHNVANAVGTACVDCVCGLNNHGYGGSALLFTSDNVDDIPGCNEPLSVSQTGNYFLKRNGLPTQNGYGDYYALHLQDNRRDNNPQPEQRRIHPLYLFHALNNGSHVILGQLRKSCIPYGNSTLAETSWVDTTYMQDTTVNTMPPDTKRVMVTSFDTFVGVHKRMYMNAFYPDNIGVRGDTAHPSSMPMMMMFPCESLVNMDIANPVNDLYDENNPDLKRISNFGGQLFKIDGGSEYKTNMPVHTYNPVYSSYLASPFLQTENDMIRVDNYPSHIYYSEFNFSSGMFDTFLPADSLVLDSAYGGINRLFSHGDNLYAFQDRAVAVMFPKQRSLLADDKSRIFIGTGEIFSEGYRYATTLYGSTPNVAIGSTQSALYWTDEAKRAILRLSSQGVEDISTVLNVNSYISEIIKQSGGLPAHRIYRNYDGTLRFVYDIEDTFRYKTDFNPSEMIFRGGIEFNEHLNMFSSFITFKANVVCNINGKNLIFLPVDDCNLPLEENTYDGYFYHTLSDIDPRISVHINPTEKYSDKEFYTVFLKDTSIPSLDTIVDLFTLMNRKNIIRHLQVYHYDKEKPIPMLDGANARGYTAYMNTGVKGDLDMHNDRYVVFGIDQQFSSHTSPYTGGAIVATQTVYKFQKLARASVFGSTISIPLDKISDLEMETWQKSDAKGGDKAFTITGKSLSLNIRFQTFNEQSRDEANRPPSSNMDKRSAPFTRRREMFFDPVSVSFDVIDLFTKE